MCNESSSKPGRDQPVTEGTAAASGNKPTDKESDPNQPKEGIIRILGPIFVDIIVAAAAATGLWLFGERLSSHGHEKVGSVLIFCAFLMYFATVPIGVSKVVSKKKRWGLYAAFAVISGLIFFCYAKAPTQQLEFLEGTQFTHKELEDFFPFGYAVIYLNEEHEMRTHEFHNKLMDWKIPWDRVKITPDFQNRTVQFSIPDISGSGRKGTFISDGSVFTVDLALTNGICRRAGFFMGDNPAPAVCVLSDNQRTPVFAIGFRIPAKGEGRPPNPPWFFIK